ncbi:autotransporter outer membrane beta-barrel domain-containing protein [Pseudomonas silvicola]|nr:autotransporter outer membrane beta-barrel domain-containing protein [Pseudomonas silvicola]
MNKHFSLAILATTAVIASQAALAEYPGERASLAAASAGTQAWYGELSGIRGRFDELRNQGGQEGVWVRTLNSKSRVSPGSGADYTQRQGGFTLGVDASLSEEARVGLMGGYSRSNLSMKGPDSAYLSSYFLGAYGTWMNREGYYVDGLVKANQLRNDLSSHYAGHRIKGQYRNLALGASVEGGKVIGLDDGWYVKPFGQMSAVALQGKEHELNYGLGAHAENSHSMLGKAGLQVGRNLMTADGGLMQPYARLAYAREFADTNEVQVHDRLYRNDMAGGRTEYGVGLVAQVAERVQLNADMEYAKGKRVEQPYGLNFGMRYAF